MATCLTMASNNNHQSIAFPALGTGNLSYPGDAVSKAMIESVIEYVQKNSNSSIKKVKIVIFHGDRIVQQVLLPLIFGFMYNI